MEWYESWYKKVFEAEFDEKQMGILTAVENIKGNQVLYVYIENGPKNLINAVVLHKQAVVLLRTVVGRKIADLEAEIETFKSIVFNIDFL